MFDLREDDLPWIMDMFNRSFIEQSGRYAIAGTFKLIISIAKYYQTCSNGLVNFGVAGG